MKITKAERQNFRGELYNAREYVGHIFKVEGGYGVFSVTDGNASPLFDGKVFKGTDFRAAGRVQLSATRFVNKYEVAA